MIRLAQRCLAPLAIVIIASLSLAGTDANPVVPDTRVSPVVTGVPIVADRDQPQPVGAEAPAIVQFDTAHLRPSVTHAAPVAAVLGATLVWMVVADVGLVALARAAAGRPPRLPVRRRGPPALHMG